MTDKILFVRSHEPAIVAMTFTDRVAKSVGRHFVTLSCVHQTAGNRFNNTAIPYAFGVEQWCVLEDSTIGLDYAAVHLGGLYRPQLEAGGIIPIAKDAWSHHVAEHDHWALVGIPRESVSYDGETMISARFVMAPLSQAEPPALAHQKADNQFFAKLADDSVGFVKDLVGMSGGPIIALRKEAGTWEYGVIGVQSAWYPSARIIAACPFTSFAKALEPVVEEALSKVQRMSGGGHAT